MIKVISKPNKLGFKMVLPKIYGYIYVTTNQIDGKYYIGQHKSDDLNDDYLGSGVYLNRAIKKYGKENFRRKILSICDNQEQLNYREIWFIKHGKAKVEHGNYNLVDGGQGSTGYVFSEESIQKMRESHLGQRTGKENNKASKVINLDTMRVFDTIKEASEYYEVDKGGISAACRKLTNTSFGYNWAYYDDYLIGNYEIHAPIKVKTEVINLDTLEVFESMVEALNKYPKCKNISYVCQGKRKTTGGYSWAYHEDYKNNSIPIFKGKHRTRKVINLDTGEVFETMTKASKTHEVDKGGIFNCCSGKRKTAGGYRWQYYEDYLREEGENN